MPRLSESLQSDLSGYAPTMTSAPTGPAPPESMQPVLNAVMRCPLPMVLQAASDAQRQFYQGGSIPQIRALALNQTTSNAAASGGTGTVIVSRGSGGGSVIPVLAPQTTITTAVLAPGGKLIGSFLLADSYQLLSAATSVAARIQLYGTALAQTIDLPRGLDVPPSAGTTMNLVCDVVLDTAPYTWTFQNRVGANGDSPQTATVYATITNLSAASVKVTTTVVYVPLET